MIYEDLTEKQARFFHFLIDFAKENGTFPSYQTIIDETWIKSKNSVYQFIQYLKEKNYLKASGSGGFELHPSKKYLITLGKDDIPIRGVITAGAMQEAVDVDLGSLSIRDLFPKAQSPFSVKVSGNSMEDIGIHDGDIVILDDSELQNGEVGAILYNDHTTLKEVHRSSDKVVLTPKSRHHSPIVLEPDKYEEVKVLGKYVAHLHNGRVQYID